MNNILNKFTIRSLKLNIKRTIATCIGIILSTALICAVAGVFSSFQQTLIEHAKNMMEIIMRCFMIFQKKNKNTY